MSVEALHREIDINVTDRQMRAYTDAVHDWPIAENQLGSTRLQEALRGLILDIFDDIRLVVTGIKARSRTNAVATAPECYLLKSLRFHELAYSPQHDVRGSFIVGLSSFWGRPTLGNYHEPDSTFAYRHVKARPIQMGESLTLLNSMRDGFPHTDSAFKPEPEPLFALFMARAAKDGGDSLIWSARSLIDWIGAQRNGKDVLELLRSKEMPFVGSVLKPEKVIHATILMKGSSDRIRYKRDAIEEATKALRREVTSDETLVMDMLDAATRNPDLTIRFAMADGDAVVLDNHRTLHSRSAYRDYERHVLKTTIYDA